MTAPTDHLCPLPHASLPALPGQPPVQCSSHPSALQRGSRYDGTALSVNVNKVALLRNSRHLGIPSVVRAAQLCLQAGAQGITIHPRPDERHIRAADVYELAELMRQWPQAEFNIEGNPEHNLMDFIRAVRPHQATFVPDSTDQFTSDHGWTFPHDSDRLRPLVQECHALGVRVSLFMDPDPAQMALARATGADRVELYTEPYAAAYAAAYAHTGASAATGASVTAGATTGALTSDAASHAAASAHAMQVLQEQLQRYAAAARAALQAGLAVNAGHDLNRDNLPTFIARVPGVAEVSIGHALIADALELGYAATVRAYRQCMDAVQTQHHLR